MLLEALRPRGLSARPAQPEDQGLLRDLFLCARPHLQSLPLPQAALAALIDQQYNFQQAGHQRRFPHASHLVVQAGDTPIGALTLHDSAADLHIVDIVLALAARGQGHGTALLRWVQGSAAVLGRRVTLSVDATNPAAQRLYRRLGFSTLSADAIQFDMQWQAPQQADPARTPPSMTSPERQHTP